MRKKLKVLAHRKRVENHQRVRKIFKFWDASILSLVLIGDTWRATGEKRIYFRMSFRLMNFTDWLSCAGKRSPKIDAQFIQSRRSTNIMNISWNLSFLDFFVNCQTCVFLYLYLSIPLSGCPLFIYLSTQRCAFRCSNLSAHGEIVCELRMEERRKAFSISWQR